MSDQDQNLDFVSGLWNNTGVIIISVVLVCGLAAGVGLVTGQQQPGEPRNFFGAVETESGEPAPTGVELYALVNGNFTSSADNPIETSPGGQYGGDGPFDQKLSVNVQSGDEVTFRVFSPTGPEANEVFNVTGAQDGTQQLNLTVPDGTFRDGPTFTTRIDAAPDRVTAGENITVGYTVENTGDATGTQPINFVVDNTVEATRSNLTLSAGENVTGSFRYSTEPSDTPNVTVEVSSENETVSETVIINESDQPLTAAFTATPETASINEQVTLNGSPSGPTSAIRGYNWSLGDGTTATGRVVTHAYTSPGQYTATLTVTDDTGDSDTATVSITVEDVTAPTADAGQNQTVDNGTSVSFDGTNSTDNVGIVSYQWEFGDGTTTTGTTPTHIYTNLGQYTATLTVTDDAGNSDTDTVIITVSNNPPTASDVSVSTSEDTPVSGTFDASDPDGDSLSYSVSSSPDHGTVSTSGDSFTYTPDNGYAGSDSFTYEVSDGNGGTDTATVSIAVTDETASPFFNISVVSTNSPVQAGDPLTVTAEIENTGNVSDTQPVKVDVPGLGSASTTVSLDAGNSSTEPLTISTSADDAGTYTATVSSDNDTASQSITVQERSPLADYANENGVVDVDGLLDAIADFRGDEIGVDLLLDVIDAFRRGDPVT